MSEAAKKPRKTRRLASVPTSVDSAAAVSSSPTPAALTDNEKACIRMLVNTYLDRTWPKAS